MTEYEKIKEYWELRRLIQTHPNDEQDLKAELKALGVKPQHRLEEMDNQIIGWFIANKEQVLCNVKHESRSGCRKIDYYIVENNIPVCINSVLVKLCGFTIDKHWRIIVSSRVDQGLPIKMLCEAVGICDKEIYKM